MPCRWSYFTASFPFPFCSHFSFPPFPPPFSSSFSPLSPWEETFRQMPMIHYNTYPYRHEFSDTSRRFKCMKGLMFNLKKKKKKKRKKTGADIPIFVIYIGGARLDIGWRRLWVYVDSRVISTPYSVPLYPPTLHKPIPYYDGAILGKQKKKKKTFYFLHPRCIYNKCEGRSYTADVSCGWSSWHNHIVKQYDSVSLWLKGRAVFSSHWAGLLNNVN